MDQLFRERREVFFSNLLLLGIDVEGLEKKYWISINRDMFVLPNKKGFEVISHFLLSCLNSVTTEDYSIIWPLYDKKLEQEFRKQCVNYILKISKDSSSSIRFPNVLQTIFLSPGGERFYELYLAFTTYVLHKHIVMDNICKPWMRPTVTAHNSEDIRQMLQMSTITATEEFEKGQRHMLRDSNEWQKHAQQAVNYYRKTKQKLVNFDKEIKELYSTMLSMMDRIESQDNIAEKEQLQLMATKNIIQIHRMMEEYRILESYLSKDKDLWNIVRTELQSECPEKIVLDGTKVFNSIPEILKVDFKSRLQEKNINHLVEEGNLSVKNVFEVLSACMEYFNQAFEKVEFSKSEEMLPVLASYTQILENSLCALEDLSVKMVAILSDISEGLENLEKSSSLGSSDEQNPFAKLITCSPTFDYTVDDNFRDSALPRSVTLSPTTVLDSSHKTRGNKLPISDYQMQDSKVTSNYHLSDNFKSRCKTKLSFCENVESVNALSWSENISANSNADPLATEQASEPQRDENVRLCIEQFQRSALKDEEGKSDPYQISKFDILRRGILGMEHDANDKFRNVKSRYAKQIVTEIETFSHSALQSPDRCYSDVFDKTIFSSKDQLPRTPAQLTTKRSYSNQLSMPNSEVKWPEVRDSYSKIPPKPPILFEHEELLFDITMPEVPFL